METELCKNVSIPINPKPLFRKSLFPVNLPGMSIRKGYRKENN